MTNMTHLIRQIISGARLIDNKRKYKILGCGAAAIHALFAITFLSIHILPLGIYNAIIVLFYLYLSLVLTGRNRYMEIYVLTFSEILLHSVLATLLVGWDWGFMVYTVALVPISFYLSYTMPHMERRMAVPMITSVTVTACYMAMDIQMRYITPVYSTEFSPWLVLLLYYFNTMLAFIFLLLFSMLFALEVRNMQYQLETENIMLEEIANYDPLTKLLNRRSMTLYLRRTYEKAQLNKEPFCVIMADIDDFKIVNDTYGHVIGDQVLVLISNIISRNVRDVDYVCRWGGEEILILLMTDLSHARKIAGRIREDILSSVVEAKEGNVKITVTMGIAEYHEDVMIQELIDEADRKLYYGKKHGKNQIVH